MILPTNEVRYGDDLDDDIQAIFRHLSGLPGRMVRPRWQPTAPWTPAFEDTWIAVAVTSLDPDEGVVITDTELTYHETVEVAVTAYGPNASRCISLARSGLKVPDNIAEVQGHGLFYVRTGSIVTAPELVNTRWLKRYDMSVTFRRKITRQYGINYIASAEATIYNVQGLEPQHIEVSDE